MTLNLAHGQANTFRKVQLLSKVSQELLPPKEEEYARSASVILVAFLLRNVFSQFCFSKKPTDLIWYRQFGLESKGLAPRPSFP